MPIFKPGDKIVRTEGEYKWEGMYLHSVYTISEILPSGQLKVEGLTRWYHASHFDHAKRSKGEHNG